MSARSSYTTRTEGYNVGFPSPASDYVEGRLTVDKLCSIGPNTRVVQTETGYAVVDFSVNQSSRTRIDPVLRAVQILRKLWGRRLLLVMVRALEGEALDDVVVLGIVTFVINRTSRNDDECPVI
ncbi:Uncharacterised protein [Klebsiella pneumoniae]|nr:Uncharacterised protein [Klebsiella pneumoniae]